ncbi:MAG: tetratricopeptide repeat protein [Bacteroidota bacterium]
MARRKKSNRKYKKEEEVLVDIVEAREQAQDFFQKYSVPVVGGFLAIVFLVGGYFIWQNMVQEPREREAVEQMFQAELQFKVDSFAQALTNPGGGYPGFLDIVDAYGSTKAGNLAKYYAGISYLRLGQYEAAIDYLQDFDANDDVLPSMKFGALGDSYSELGNFDNAITNYLKAAGGEKNEYTTPYFLMKCAMLYERNSQPDKALSKWEEIYADYPGSQQGQMAEKYINRLSGE